MSEERIKIKISKGSDGNLKVDLPESHLFTVVVTDYKVSKDQVVYKTMTEEEQEKGTLPATFNTEPEWAISDTEKSVNDVRKEHGFSEIEGGHVKFSRKRDSNEQ